LLPRSSEVGSPNLELERQAAQASSVIRAAIERQDPLLLVTHFDADGLSAGSIILAGLNRLNAKVHLKVVENLSDRTLEEIDGIDSNTVIFTDIGSGYLEPLTKRLGHRQLVIADHHQVLGEAPSNLVHFNPHAFGFNGSTDISGAGTAYLLARDLDPKNRDLSAMALVGCLGDQQDKGPKRTLTGLNAEILRDAIQMQLVEESQDLIFFGRQTRPVYRAIASTTSPFLPGLSGEEDKCLALLDKANIPTKIEDRWRTISDLSMDEKRRLVDRIIQHMVSLKMSGEIVLELIGAVYTLLKEDPWTPLRDAREYATLLNACGRMGRPSLGIALGIGDRGTAFEEAQQVYIEYKKSLSKYMNWVATAPSALRTQGNIVVVQGEGVIDESMTGAVSSLVSASNLFGESKVTLVITATSEGALKVSARATDQLVAKGVNLGRILQGLAPNHGGYGGGHAIAAGATIDKESLERFLGDFRRIVDSVLT
jgi:single-stranded-DNA-specific exonuclease